MAKDTFGRELEKGDVVLFHGTVVGVDAKTGQVTVQASNASAAAKAAHAKAEADWKAERDAIQEVEKKNAFIMMKPCPQCKPEATVVFSDPSLLEKHV